jgi:RNA polymerase sigma factor (sigma-70 family)
MPAVKTSTVLWYLRRVASLPDGRGMTDAQLLECFLDQRDDAAFAALMRRHGPMVFGVCHRVLGNSHDAEDAFQATFLVLVRKARSVGQPDLLGNWLYGVAYRTAMAARGETAKRMARERETAKPEAAIEGGGRELAALLDRELNQLPEKYRAPIVLCDLQGMTRKDAARQLGWPEGTVHGRLARGRGFLAKRLARQGLALSGGVIAAVSAQQAVSACMPAGLEMATLKAATATAGTAMTTGIVPAKVVALTRRVVQTMLLTKLKVATVVALLATCALFSATGWLMRYEARAYPPDETGRSSDATVAGNKFSRASSRLVGLAPVKEPAWKMRFRKSYGLKDNELIRRVGLPFPECRAEYFRNRLREFYEPRKIPIPDEELKRDYSDHFTKFGWKGDWTVDDLLMQTTPIKPDVGARLAQLLHVTTGFGSPRTQGDADLLDRKVTGDFVVRAGADPTKVAAALAKILRKECGLSVSLAVQEVERDVYVLSGKYEAKPLADRKKNQIEVYSFDLTNRRTGGGGSGSLSEMADHVEGFIESPIVVGEVKGAPKTVEWHYNSRSPFTAQEWAQDHDAEAVMRNISAQTGLTAKREKRKIKVLMVKKPE